MIDQIQRIDDIVLGFINIDLRSGMLDKAVPEFSRIGNLGLIWIVV